VPPTADLVGAALAAAHGADLAVERGEVIALARTRSHASNPAPSQHG